MPKMNVPVTITDKDGKAVDLSTQAPREFTPLPDGVYTGLILGCFPKIIQGKGGRYYAVELQIMCMDEAHPMGQKVKHSAFIATLTDDAPDKVHLLEYAHFKANERGQVLWTGYKHFSGLAQAAGRWSSVVNDDGTTSNIVNGELHNFTGMVIKAKVGTNDKGYNVLEGAYPAQLDGVIDSKVLEMLPNAIIVNGRVVFGSEELQAKWVEVEEASQSTEPF